MAKRKRKRRKNQGYWKWFLFFLFILSVILVVDLKPWRALRKAVSDEWPYKDLTKGAYTTDFDGLDISRHQGKIHWDELVEENPKLRFVYIKATEGSSVIDPFYKRNFEAAKKRGLLVGSYHFLTYRTSMERQVENFLTTIDMSQQDLLLLVDVETDGTKKWEKEEIRENLTKFIELIKERTGHAPMIYTNEKYYEDNLAPLFNNYHLFIANYSTPPNLDGAEYDIWQSSKKGRVRGIWTYVDIDQLREGVSLNNIKMPH